MRIKFWRWTYDHAQYGLIKKKLEVATVRIDLPLITQPLRLKGYGVKCFLFTLNIFHLGSEVAFF